jgi:cytoskeletal protein CcmA (bactofilin family)
MFNKHKNNLVVRQEASVPTVIAKDLSIIGNLVSEGTIEIAGRIEGNIKCDSLNLHATGLIKGDVIAKSAKINGEINGVIKAKQVSIGEKGKIHGFVIYETIAITEGAVIFGQLKQNDRDDIVEDHTTSSAAAPIKESAPSATARKIRLVKEKVEVGG